MQMSIVRRDSPMSPFNRLCVCCVLVAGLVAVQSSLLASGNVGRAPAAGQATTEDLDFVPAIAKIAGAAEGDFTGIAGTKVGNEYKTSLRIKYRGATYGGLIRPFPGGGWSCTYPVLLTLRKEEADAAFSEWTTALTSAFGSGQLRRSPNQAESSVQSHSNLERVAADAPVSTWGAERGRTGVRLFYTVNRDDSSYYIEVMFSRSGP
jgi:hypothetical protein